VLTTIRTVPSRGISNRSTLSTDPAVAVISTVVTTGPAVVVVVAASVVVVVEASGAPVVSGDVDSGAEVVVGAGAVVATASSADEVQAASTSINPIKETSHRDMAREGNDSR
jgi:hypothetical protein